MWGVLLILYTNCYPPGVYLATAPSFVWGIDPSALGSAPQSKYGSRADCKHRCTRYPSQCDSGDTFTQDQLILNSLKQSRKRTEASPTKIKGRCKSIGVTPRDVRSRNCFDTTLWKEDATMNDEKERLYRCPVCDTVVEVLDRVGIDLVCCGPAMIPLKPRTERCGADHHLPLIRPEGEGLTVVVGAGSEHPMVEDHHIEWIEVAFDSKCFRHFLKPGQKPSATFDIGTCDREVSIQAYCNVHGLWESVEKISPAAFGCDQIRNARIGETGFTSVQPNPGCCGRDTQLIRTPL